LLTSMLEISTSTPDSSNRSLITLNWHSCKANSDLIFQALNYYNLALKYNQSDESAFLNRAITKVRSTRKRAGFNIVKLDEIAY
jgi:hypothetical protein